MNPAMNQKIIHAGVVLVTFVLSKKFLSLYLRKKKEKAIFDLLFFLSLQRRAGSIPRTRDLHGKYIFSLF